MLYLLNITYMVIETECRMQIIKINLIEIKFVLAVLKETAFFEGFSI